MGLDAEYERYSADQEWMPRLVMLAKSTYVWLDQLSKKYQRPIKRLDQIPDEELDTLARWGFSGLWLIGLWERSQASQRIKQIMGNPEAVASAYSLFDYQIAADLGGEEAYRNLAGRTWQRGIRLASDMVPNHMGSIPSGSSSIPTGSSGSTTAPSHPIRSTDRTCPATAGWASSWKITTTTTAMPPSSSSASTAGRGSTRYIYHGNDGTSMPWNDTAQLDYLNPAVREAVIQTILEVARRFPVIRFDAAMTLAKRHVQRLWFPEPGTGGAIASRSEHAITKAQFDAAMPVEFWREVVERVAREVPDTLLLAEAFWMMEGYFVRTLGMHRVYNSAFMNMLKAEENAKYRSSIKNVLEFDAEILKRYVNFMNNPDEETAIAQFGRDDKYFGVCTMMVTMPGLPMIGHGQVEGYTEKYGMEYRRAYKDEQPDTNLVQRHEREIFPLMQRRHIFSGVHNFLLYDFYAPEGHVNEEVFAYSNSSGDSLGAGERGLVLFNNKFAEARGWIRASAAFSVKTGEGDNRVLIQKTLGEGLGLHADWRYFTIFREQRDRAGVPPQQPEVVRRRALRGAGRVQVPRYSWTSGKSRMTPRATTRSWQPGWPAAACRASKTRCARCLRRLRRPSLSSSSPGPAGSCCTSPRCRDVSASATWETRPTASSISWKPAANSTGRSCPSARRATATRPTRRSRP